MTHTCVICKEKIIESKEKWVHLIDYDKKQVTGETFYHLECWKKRFQIDNSARKQKMYKQAMGSIGSIVENMKKLQDSMPVGIEVEKEHEDVYYTKPLAI